MVSGGIGTIIVVLSVGRLWPQMRNLGTLDAPKEMQTEVIAAEAQAKAIGGAGRYI